MTSYLQIPLLTEAVRLALTPPPNLTVSQWADLHRRLSAESSAEPGQWITDRAPFQRGLMDAVNDPSLTEIWVMKSAQVGWTECLNNVIGYYADQDPAPMLLIQPTLEMANAWSKDRLAPMVRDSPRLTHKIADSKAKDSGNTLLHKSFVGGHITIAGANSPAGLASRPVRIVLFDEVDRYPNSAGAEGDPVSLARKRTTTFWNRKLLAGSTPTIKGKSRIEAGFQMGDQRRYFVPCPHCDTMQTLKWAFVTWPDGDPESAWYACESCGCAITDNDKGGMLARGEWRATAEPKRAGIASFHINELYSPWVTFGQMAASFYEAKRLPDTLRTWVNTSLGEPDDVTGDTVDETGLLERREVYPAEVPSGVVMLTCGVDVQDNRIELEVVGHGVGQETWSIAYKTIEGDPGQHPSHSPLWQQLDEYLNQTFDHESGIGMRIAGTCIDTGYKTDMVYAFCKPRFARRVFAIKGVGGQGRPAVTKPTRNNAGGVRVFALGVDTLKELVYSRLKIAEPGPGYCHFPADRPLAFFEGLTAEKLITTYFKGKELRKWVVKSQHVRNEPLDCRGYAVAALEILGVDLDKKSKAMARRLSEREQKQPEPEVEPVKPQAQARKFARPQPPKRGGWATGWRG